eukprot:TRINITY_DN2062_c0_g2_i1.p1 TRINITY_DN2062_c0_g2~~TRINITY_DN2062_c0_g2_i1.p1  ORF type:complete len:3605 (+),score=818.56 TRINITY_DN2062_c0_g2_i1:687-10817(+)
MAARRVLLLGGDAPAGAAADLGLSHTPFSGSLAQVGVWDRALSQHEVRALAMGIPVGGAALRWPLDGHTREEGSGPDFGPWQRWSVGPLQDPGGGSPAAPYFPLDAPGRWGSERGGPPAEPELGAAWAPEGVCGGAAVFDGKGAALSLGEGALPRWAALSGAAAVSVSAWVRPDDPTRRQVIFSIPGGPSVSDGADLELGLEQGLRPRAELARGTAACLSRSALSAGVWAHLSLAVSYEGPASSAVLYVGGERAGSCGAGGGLLQVHPLAAVAVGARIFRGAERVGALRGAVSHLAVSRQALSPAAARCAARVPSGCRLPTLAGSAPFAAAGSLPPPSAAGGVAAGAGSGPRGTAAAELSNAERQHIRLPGGGAAMRGARAVSAAGWVRLEEPLVGPARPPGLVVGAVSPEAVGLLGRWCADGSMLDLSGAGAHPDNYTADAVGSGPSAPFPGRGPSCGAPFSAPGEWPGEGGVEAWVRFPSQPGAWPQPLVRWDDSDNPGAFFELAIGPVAGGEASEPGTVIEGHWCADTAEAGEDIGPWGRHASPLLERPAPPAALSAATFEPTMNLSAPVPGMDARLGCAFDGPQTAPLLAPPRAAFPRPGSYMAWVAARHHGSGSFDERYTLIRGVALGQPAPSARVALGHCRGDGLCSLEFEAAETAGVLDGLATHRFKALDRWVHVAVTWAGDGTARLYVNGALAKYGTVRRSVAAATSVLVGGDWRLGEEVRGLLYDVRVYSGVLYGGEIYRISRGLQRYAAHLRWRSGPDEALVNCGEGDAEGAPLPVGEWLRVSAGWGNGSAWAANGGTPQRTSCVGPFGAAGNTSQLLQDFARLDRVEILGAGAFAGQLNRGVTAVASAFDVRVLRHRAGLRQTPLEPPAPTDWQVGLLVRPQGLPVLRMRGAPDEAACEGTELPRGRWAHLAAVWPGGDELTWMLDGRAVCRSPVRGAAYSAALAMAEGDAYAGGTPWGWQLSGGIAEVLLQRAALPAQLIAMLHAGAGVGGALAPPPELSCSLLAWWPFDDPEGADLAADVTGAHDAAVRGPSALAGAGGRQGRGGLEADPALGNYADAGSAANLGGMSSALALSVAAWVRHRPGAAPGRTVLLSSADASRPSWAEGTGAADGHAEGECFRGSRVLLALALDEPAGAAAVGSSGREGVGGNAVTVVDSVQLGYPGVHGTAVLLPSGRTRAFLGKTSRSVGGSGTGFTVMFWAMHETAGGIEVPGKGRRALYELAREPGEFGKAFIACESTNPDYIHFAVDTAEGIVGPPRSSEHFIYGRWQHVALSLAADVLSVYRDGELLWTGEARNATTPWTLGSDATVVAHYGHGYEITRATSCGEGNVFEVPPHGHAYIEGSPEDCEHVCNQYDQCEGFVYIWDGDVAPAYRCYLRTGTSNATLPTASRDCYTKMRGAAAPDHAAVAVDDLVLLDWALPAECVASAAGAQDGVAQPARACGAVGRDDVLLHLPVADAAGSVFTEAEAGVVSRVSAAADLVDFAAAGAGPRGAGAGRVLGQVAAGLTLARGCWSSELEERRRSSGTLWGDAWGDVILSLVPVNTTSPLGNISGPLSLRVRAANTDSAARTVGLWSAASSVFVEVLVPAGAGERSWHAGAVSAAADCGSGCSLVYTGDATAWTGNLTIYEVMVCPGDTADAGCAGWRCSCEVLADEWGLGNSDNCSDAAMQAWWDLSCMSNGTAVAVPYSRPYWGCSLPVDDGAMTLAWWMRSPAAATGRAWLPGPNCSAAYAVARTAATAAVGVWRWWLCASGPGGALWLAATVDGVGQDERLTSTGGDFGLGSWVHVTLTVDGSRRAVYGDGVEVHRAAAAGRPRISWHRTAQFFPQYLGSDLATYSGPHHIDVAELVLLRRALCPAAAAALHRDGLVGALVAEVPCPLSVPSADLTLQLEPWALLRFDEGWLSDGGMTALDTSSNRNHFQAVSLPSELGAAHGGARDGAGPALRVRRGPEAALRSVSTPPASGAAYTVAFWVNLADAGAPSSAMAGAVSCVVCEARACDYVGTPLYAGTAYAATAEACRARCAAKADCAAATWLNGPGQPEHGRCTLATVRRAGPAFAAIAGGGAVGFLRRPGGRVVQECASPPLAACGVAEDGSLGNETSDAHMTLAHCRALCAAQGCVAGEWLPEYPSGRPEYGACTLAAGRNATPAFATRPVTAFVADPAPALGVAIFTSGTAELRIGMSTMCPSGAASLGLRGVSSGVVGALQPDSSPILLRQWHHVVFTVRGSAVPPELRVDGAAVASADIWSLGNRAGGVPPLDWGTAEWLHAAAAGTRADALFDDLAVWARALQESEALAVWRGAAGLSPSLQWHGGVWHHIAWSLGRDGQTWYVDGDEARRCPAATPAAFASPHDRLWIGRAHGGEGFSGTIDDVRIYGHTLSTAEVRALHRGAAWHAAAPEQAAAAATPAASKASATTVRLPQEPPADPTAAVAAWPWTVQGAAWAPWGYVTPPVTPAGTPPPPASDPASVAGALPGAAQQEWHSLRAGDCTGCSRDCGAACHESFWRFDDQPPAHADESGNERHAYSDGAVSADGVFGTPGVADGGGGGVVLPAWEGLRSNRFSWFAWVRPVAEARGVIVAMEGVNPASNGTLRVWQEGSMLCADAGGIHCCSGENLLEADRWVHLGVAAALDKGALTLFVGGARVRHCRGAPGAVEFDPPVRGIGLLKPAAPGGLGALPAFTGSIDEVRVATAERTESDARTALRDAVCPTCGRECPPPGVVAGVAALTNDGGVDLATEFWNRAPFGGRAARAGRRRLAEGLPRLWCRREGSPSGEDDDGTVLVGVHMMPLARQGGADVVIPSPSAAMPGCTVRCRTGDPTMPGAVTAELSSGCPEGDVFAAARHSSGGWYHCVARFNSSGVRRTRVAMHITEGDPLLVGGLHWQSGAACGDGVLDAPGEDCDPAAKWQARKSACDARLCVLPDSPFFTDADAHYQHDPPAPPRLQVVLHPSYGGELAGLKIFLSSYANCSDAVDRDTAAVDATGVASIAVDGAGLPVVDPEARYICTQTALHSDPNWYGVARRWASPDAPGEALRIFVLPCMADCQSGGACNPLTGACSCPFGYAGAACDSLVDGCAVGPAEADCEESAATTLPLATIEVRTAPGASPRFRANPCAGAACVANGGACRVPGICVCPTNFAPPDCDSCIDGRSGALCEEAHCGGMCSSHGTCFAAAGGGAVCRCDDGWLGRGCDRPAGLLSAGGSGTSVSSDGRRIWREAASPQGPHARVIAVMPTPGLPDRPVWFALTADLSAAGVAAGFCAAEGSGPIGADAHSWGVSWDGRSLVLVHDGSRRRAGAGPVAGDAVAVRWEPAAGVVFAATAGGAAFPAFLGACPGGVCFGCLSLPPGAAATIVDHS